MSSTVPYQRRTFPLTQPLSTFLWQVRGDGDGVEATGECPRCRCVTTKVITAVQYVTKGPSKPLRELVASGEPRPARCQCATLHTNRPDEVPDGCGASFWIALPPQGLSL
ncbi:hypothetical protein ACFY8C_01285 [Streptomyces flavochromogenes]|uniref:Uncharacterized protein n=1 Tax=Streptomyces flavochromogenes TaxID=68199 RepID=A0ABW6XHL7_9ACTN|nr:hypothetical protein [Streptomyces flavochromogenes]